MDSPSNRSPAKKTNIPERRPIVTQAWLADIASLERAVALLEERVNEEREIVISLVDAGAAVEPGSHTVRIVTRFGRRVVERKVVPFAPVTGASSGAAPVVTQQRLERIADLESTAKIIRERLREEQRMVLEALQAGAPVEPGRFRARIRTRWRRRKAS